MQRGERPVVTGIHGLKHFQRLSATALANDCSVGRIRNACYAPNHESALAYALRRWFCAPIRTTCGCLQTHLLESSMVTMSGYGISHESIEQRSFARPLHCQAIMMFLRV